MLAPDIQQVLDVEQQEAELLAFMRIEEWATDLWAFGYECLGNNAKVHPDLCFMDEPRVKASVRKIGFIVRDWLGKRATQTKMRQVLVLWPRKCGKSTTLTRGIPIWLNACHDPEIATLIGTARKKGEGTTSDRVMRAIMEHFEGDQQNSKLIETYGDFRGDLGDLRSRRQWSTEGMVTSKRRNTSRQDPTVGGFSVETGATGGHPDMILLDDLIPGYEYCYESWFDSVRTTHLSCTPLLGMKGLLMVIATMYEEGDHITWIRDELIAPKVRKRMKGQLPRDFKDNWPRYAYMAGWEVIFERGVEGDIYDENSTVNFPLVWSREALIDYKEKSPAEYAAQIQNDPASREDWPLHEPHIEKLWIEREDIPAECWNKVTMHMDLAWKDYEAFVKAKGDYSVIQYWGHDYAGNVYYLPYAYMGKDMQEGFDRIWVTLLQEAYRDGARVFAMTWDKLGGGESGGSANHFQNLATAHCMPCPPKFQIQRGSGNKKDSRIMEAARYWIDGRVRLCKGAPFVNDLVSQMLRRSRFKDMADAAADVFHPDLYRPGRRVAGMEGVGPSSAAARWRGARPLPKRGGELVIGADITGKDLDPIYSRNGWRGCRR